ncbi:MAG: histidine kinase, partial [Bacteroidota bacterium]
MRQIIILILLIVMPAAGFNQVAEEINKINADSLKEVLTELSDIERIDALNKIALAISLDNSDSSILLANSTILMSEESDYQKGIADGYFNLGNAYYIQDSLKLSVLNYLIALRLYEQLPPFNWMAITLGNLASINWLIGRTDKAIEYQRRQFLVTKQLEVPLHNKWGAVILIAYYFDGIGKYDSAYYYCDQAFEVARQYNDTSYITYTYTNLFRFKLHQAMADPADKEKLDQCISIGLKALELRNHLDMDQQGRYIWHRFMYLHLAEAYFEEGSEYSIDTGLEYLNKAKSVNDSIESDHADAIRIYGLYASLRSRYRDYEGAIAYYEKGIRNFKKNIPWSEPDYLYEKVLWTFIDKNILRAVYDSLHRNYKRIGNYRKALEYNVLRNKVENEIFLEEQMNTVAMLEADSEIEQIEKQVDMLERDKQIKDLQVAQSRNINIGIGTLFVIFILLGIFYLRQLRLKNEYKSSILEQKLLRLQMNPHFIFNALSSIHNLVIKQNNEKASAYLVDFSQLLRTSLESSREDFILLGDEISIIQNYLELQRLRHDEKFDFSIEVDRQTNAENAIIPPMLIQPFIENAIEHGIRHKQSKGHVSVSFKREDNKVICEIEDD